MKPDETKSDQPTPEELLKQLDDQIAEQRKRKKNTPMRRAILLMVGFLIIFGGLLAAFFLFQYMAQDLPRSPKKQPPASAQ
jgi:cell division septal protein FtsQ